MTAELTSLFVGSLLASTLIPGGVEALLYYLYQAGEHGFSTLLMVATVGNTLGAIISYFIGFVLHRSLAGFGWHQRIQKLFKLQDKALSRVKKWGVPILFFSWLPIIGDPLCLAAGYLRLAFLPSAAMIFISKFVRYAVLLWVFTQPWSAWSSAAATSS